MSLAVAVEVLDEEVKDSVRVIKECKLIHVSIVPEDVKK